MKAIVDCNSFYCSCERVFRPDLFQKPVVAFNNNDAVSFPGIKRRNCCFTISNECIILAVSSFVASKNYWLKKQVPL
ncbi:MAG: hypothetical protein ACTHML_02780 [Ginsengibacter sp.]